MTDPMSTVRQYTDAFNRGDVKAMAQTFFVSGSILDGLPPHAWNGPTAVQDWYRDVIAASKREGATDYAVTLGEPRHVDVTGDSAYVVVPASMTFTVRGERVNQSGATLTVALRRDGATWRIVAWAWTKGLPARG
jgi:ketosteroid isomerase-like protein